MWYVSDLQCCVLWTNSIVDKFKKYMWVLWNVQVMQTERHSPSQHFNSLYMWQLLFSRTFLANILLLNNIHCTGSQTYTLFHWLLQYFGKQKNRWWNRNNHMQVQLIYIFVVRKHLAYCVHIWVPELRLLNYEKYIIILANICVSHHL